MKTDTTEGLASCHTVAKKIADAYGLSDDSQIELCRRLLGAVASGEIQARKTDGTTREMVGNDWLAKRPVYHPCVWVDDVNKWLAGKYPYVWVPGGTNALQAEGINSLPTKTSHKRRGNSLDAAITRAIEKAGCDEPASVYTALHELALNGDAPPFTGARANASLCYTSDNDEIASLSKDALRKRLATRRKNATSSHNRQ